MIKTTFRGKIIRAEIWKMDLIGARVALRRQLEITFSSKDMYELKLIEVDGIW